MTSANDIYSFAMRGLLTEEALDRAGRQSSRSSQTVEDRELARLVALESLDEQYVSSARSMAIVYTAVAAFRKFSA